MTIDKDVIPDRRLIIALVVLLAVRFVFAAHIDFIEDEAYYRLWGLYPSYAYFDHAPMVGWWIAIGQTIWGDTEFGLRFMSPVAAFIGSLFVWRIALLSFNHQIANHAVVLFNAMPMIGLGSILMTPDVPSVFFWGLAIWTLAEWNRTDRNSWWLLFGFAAGLGLLSKYTNIFLGVGVLIWLVTSGRWRQAIGAPQFYFAGLIAIVLFSPVIYWNAIHDWASFSKQFGRLQTHQFTFRFLGEWLGGQILLISPVIFGFLIAAPIFRKKVRLDRNINAQLIVLSFIPMLGYFLIHAFSSRINANWTVPLFSNFAILAAISLRHVWGNRNSKWNKLALFAAPIGFGMTVLVLAETLFSILPASTKNPVTQIRGYEALANDIRSIAKAQNASALLTHSYQMTGLLSYHLKDMSVIQLTERIRYENMPKLEAKLFSSSMLLVVKRGMAETVLKSFKSCYENGRFLQDVERMDRGFVLSTFEVWQIDGLDPNIFKHVRVGNCIDTQ